MTNVVTQVRNLTKRRKALLAGTVSLGLAGLIAGEAFFAHVSPAQAQNQPPVQAMQPIGMQNFSFADVVERVRPAVVSIRVRGEVVTPRDSMLDVFPPEGSPLERFFRNMPRPGTPDGRQGAQGRNGGRPNVTMSQGSGFIISATGDVVTNFHVVKDATEVMVVGDDGTEYKAKVIGSDEKTDVALVRIQSDKKDFPTVPFASGATRVGDWVLAVGNPFGLGGTVTAGIVSARGRDIGTGPYDDFLQIDAPINRGNSGGPTFNLAGEVVGMNTAIYSPSGGSIGIGFAIPSATVQQVIGQLEKGGEVVRGWLGVQIQPVTRDVADSMGIAEARGALVTEPQPNSPAQKAGIKSGDVILSVDGRPVRNSRELARLVAGYGPGTTVKLKVLAGGNTRDVEVALGKFPDSVKQASNNRVQGDDGAGPAVMGELGLAVAPASDVGEGKDGVVVVRVEPNSPAGDRNVSVGDVILEVQGRTVATAADVTGAIRDARKAGRTSILMRVKSTDGTRFLAIPIG